MFGKRARQSPTATDGLDQRVVISDVAPCRKSLRVQVAPEVIAPVRAAVVGEFQKRAELPGFRKGKAPAELVAKHFASSIHDETLHRVTRQAFEQVVKEHDLKPIGPFAVSKAEYQEPTGLTLEATVEVEPEFALGAYRGLRVQRPSAQVMAADVEAALGKLQESMARLVPAGEGEAKQRQVPPLDDELAKDVGLESLPKLREHVEAKLREQKRVAQEQAVESRLCEALLTRHTFAVPPALVGEQTERLKRDFTVRLLLSGIPEASVNEEAAKFTEQLRTDAERHVKLMFVLDRIAEQEQVSVTEQELVGRLWQLARRWKKDPAEVRRTLDQQGLWPSVFSTLRREKTIAIIKKAAVIEEAAAARPS